MRFLIYGVLVFVNTLIFAQDDQGDMTDVTYEVLYDEPYKINKLFVGVQPLYGEQSATNVNAGFGIDAHYFLRDKADFRVQLRKTFTSSFFDQARGDAARYSSVQNKPETYYYYEFGVTWHVTDFEDQSETKMALRQNTYRGDRWAWDGPRRVDVPCAVRKIYGARFGGIIWNSTLDVNDALRLDGKTNLDFGAGAFTESENIFSSIYSAGIYAGGSMTWIKNVAARFEKYERALDDGMITLYADILYSSHLKVRDVEFNGQLYQTDILKLKSFGFRAGVDGKFNRKLSWGYGGELGYRPSVANMGLFAVLKIAMPMVGLSFDHK
jgi:hypothetical protein